ncbi:major facilitator superfamily protein [Sarocladium implicatum]|nr:major facilitator superfamily protein [Sarocladium implicatum]
MAMDNVAKGLEAAADQVEGIDTETRNRLEKSINRKFDLRILPLCTLMHLCSMIDRSNMGNANVLGMSEDVDLTGNRFNIALSVFFATYITFEIPANMALRRLGPKYWLPFLTIGFGIVTMCHAFVKDYNGLIACRVVLGAFEAGVLPGIVYTLSMVYRRHQLATRMGWLNGIVVLSGAFGGLLATGFSRIPQHGILHSWRWIFLLEGIITAIVGFAVFMLPNSLETASFLTDEEREYAISRLVEEAKALPNERLDKKAFMRALKHWPTQLSALALICSLCCQGSMQLFAPTILTNMGYTGQEAQLMSVPPYVYGAICLVIVGTLSDRLKNRGFFVVFFLAPCCLIGFTLNQFVSSVGVRYFGLFLTVSGGFTASPHMLTWAVDNSSGLSVKAIVAAYAVGVGGLGQFLSTWTYMKTEAPKFTTGHSINMTVSVLMIIFAGGHSLYAIRENRKRDQGKRDHRLVNEAAGLGHEHPNFRFTP